MARFDSLRNVATRLIARNGRIVTLRKVTDGPLADANRPWEPSTQTFQDFQVRCVMVPFSLSEIDGTSILARDKRAHISAQDIGDVQISPKDRIIDGGRQYDIIEVDDISPGEQKILYICQVRG